MSDIMASIGIEQLKRFSFFKKKRQMIAKLYDNYFKDQASIELLSINYNKVVPHIYAIKVINRKKEFLRKELMKINIETGFHYVPNHQLDFFKKYNKKKLPISESLAKSLVSLPLHVDLKKKDVRYIALNVIKILRDKTYSNL